jgi:sugar O-acyltransferase (sialic acid O-acetyltransferase NeuD family)
MSDFDKIVIFGNGETALLAYEYFSYDTDFEVAAFSVDEEYIEEKEINGLPVVSTSEITQKYPPSDYAAFVAASSGKMNRSRTKLYKSTKDRGYELVSYISSKAFVWRNVEVGENCFILEDNTLQPFTKIGNNVTLWSGNHIGHRSVIEDNCFVSSHCVISGFCTIKENTFLGVNCTIENNTVIGRDNFIGAGAIISKDTADQEMFLVPRMQPFRLDTHRFFKIKDD